MSEDKKAENTNRKTRTIEEEIAHTEAKLRKLQELQKEKKRKESERNQKAVLDLIKSERLDVVPAIRWKEMLPKIKELLIV